VSDASSGLLRAVDRRGVATLTFDRPEKGNSLSPAMLDALYDALGVFGTDPAVRAIVLRGNGKHFSAGAEVGAGKPRVAFPALCLALDSLPKPIVAFVHGACIGGAVALAGCCDVAIATREAFFALPEVRLGFAPGPLIPFFLRAMEPRSLRRYLLSGERFGAEEALRIGLVHRLCDADAGEAALGDAIDELLLAGPQAAAHAKALLRRLGASAIDVELLAELQADFDARARSEEATEGRASFREKRKPVWYPQ
jgi:methylglutaconyl-CoA hydratase